MTLVYPLGLTSVFVNDSFCTGSLVNSTGLVIVTGLSRYGECSL